MGILKSITTPERALQEIRRCIKRGRDLVGRGEWQDLLMLVKDMKELVDYLHTWSDALEYESLQYKSNNTDILLEIIREAREQIMSTYPEKNFYGYPLPIDGESRKKRALSSTWDLFEQAFNMRNSYGRIEEEESIGIFDKYGKKNNAGAMPKELRGDK